MSKNRPCLQKSVFLIQRFSHSVSHHQAGVLVTDNCCFFLFASRCSHNLVRRQHNMTARTPPLTMITYTLLLGKSSVFMPKGICLPVLKMNIHMYIPVYRYSITEWSWHIFFLSVWSFGCLRSSISEQISRCSLAVADCHWSYILTRESPIRHL